MFGDQVFCQFLYAAPVIKRKSHSTVLRNVNRDMRFPLHLCEHIIYLFLPGLTAGCRRERDNPVKIRQTRQVINHALADIVCGDLHIRMALAVENAYVNPVLSAGSSKTVREFLLVFAVNAGH